MSTDTLVSIVTDSTLDEQEKAAWIERIKKDGENPGLLEALKLALRATTDSAVKAVLATPSGDPAIEKAKKKLQGDETKAAQTFAKEMDDIAGEAKKLNADIATSFDKLQVENIKSMME